MKQNGVAPESVVQFVTSRAQRMILGHTRAPTGGAPVDFDNNHPFSAELHNGWPGRVYLAHNGILLNHVELRQVYGFYVPPQVQTDSAVIPYMVLAHWRERGSIAEGIRQVCEELRGSYACWLWAAGLASLYVFRCISPLYYRRDDGLFAFSSVMFSGSVELPEGVVLEYNPERDTLRDVAHFWFYNPYSIPR
jgi:glucosamine 6-phosphate synthetase-like amidotransferase/phosphosugar isomerase protein